MSTQYFRRAEACDYIEAHYGVRYAIATLAKLAVVGGGPAFIKIGSRPVYTREDLDAWMRSRMSGKKRHTSDVGEARVTSGGNVASHEAPAN
jgi:hypothetical protein